MVLVLTNTEDLTSDFIVRELRKREIPFARLNTDEFPKNALGTFRAGFEEDNSSILRWSNRKKVLDWKEVKSVLYRRPISPVPDEKIEEPEIRKFCVDESYEFLRGLWYSLDCYWMSQPEAIRKAEHKIFQLNMVERMPFLLPKTVITNSASEVRRLAEECSSGIVIKPLYQGSVGTSENHGFIFTSEVSESDSDDLDQVKFAPSIFQEKIEKGFDVRVTVVGRRVFSAKIEPASLPKGIPDWRYAELDQLRHTVYELPYEIEQACVTLVDELNLQFGAIDLIVDGIGRHYFLEINPNGQWAWLEKVLAFPISSAIVDELSQNL